jgi:hypothetical protein
VAALSTLLKDAKVKTGIIILVLALFCYVAYKNWIDRVHSVDLEITQLWELIERVSEERLDLLPQFAGVISETLPSAQPLANELNSVSQQVKGKRYTANILSDPQALQDFVNQQQAVATILRKMQVMLGASLNQDPRYSQLNSALEQHDLQIGYAVHALNQRIIFYNQLIDRFPERVVNKITKFQPKYNPEVPTLES